MLRAVEWIRNGIANTNQSVSSDLELFDSDGCQWSVRMQISASCKMFESQQVAISHEIDRSRAIPAGC